ncbi:MAG TPA: S41 family peptidase [Candidatus Dormibacteraeota bacterium]
MSGDGGTNRPPDTEAVWSPQGPRRRARIPVPPPAVTRVLTTVAACYLTALVVLNLSASQYGGFINRIFPHIGAGSTIDANSITAEWQTVQQNYVIRDVPGGQGTQAAEQGIVQMLHDHYNDRFSAFLTTQQYQQLNATLGGRRDGSIGIALQARCGVALCASGQTPDDAVIEDVLVNQPADRAGIRRGDVLIAVDGVTLASMANDEATRIDRSSTRVRGQMGTTVRLTVVRGGSRLTLTATRQNLTIPSVYTRLLGHTLYMQVTGFDQDTGDALRTQLRSGLAAGATSLILDLRGNGGGYVTAAQALVSQFVQPTSTQKYVVVRRGRLAANGDPNSAQSVVSDPIVSGGLALTQPMVVLVDGDTASAAEITTAALHDYHRATVVGAKTFGKGSVQVDFPLPDGADLHLTVERWYGPSGETIEGKGVTPDRAVALPSPEDRFQLDAQSSPASGDAQLQAALAVLGGT